MPPELPPKVLAALGLAVGVSACGPCLDYAPPAPTADTGTPATDDTATPTARAAPDAPAGPSVPPAERAPAERAPAGAERVDLDAVLPADVAARLRARAGR